MRASSLGGVTTDKERTLDAEPYRKQFIEAMDDDFNTPQAMAALFDLARDINQAGDEGVNFRQAQKTLTQLAKDVLGLRLNIVIEVPSIEGKASVGSPTLILGANPTPELEERVNRLVEERLRCRKAKNWQQSDKIRARLAELGVVLEDTPQGTKRVWKRTPSVEMLDKLIAELGVALEDKPQGTVWQPRR